MRWWGGAVGLLLDLGYSIAFFALLALPFVAGLRIARGWERLLIAGAVACALLLAPSKAWSTALLYQRLTLFLLPAYAWLFGAAPAEAGSGAAASQWLRPAVNALCALALGVHLEQALLFSRETRDFEAVLAKAQPGQRALSLIFDRRSAAGVIPSVYLQFPAWYQADKHGFVDFNFAAYHPEIVQFKQRPLVDGDFVWDPARFRWSSYGGSAYRYFFVRSSSPLPPTLFAGADCRPVRIAQSGLWRLFENRPCGPPKR